MNNRERIELEIERASYQEVVKQLSKGCDARMETGLNEFLCGIETKIEEISLKLNSDFNANEEDEIRKIAHRIWLEAGSPDGEKVLYQYGKSVKLKNIHWQLAVTEWIYGPDYLRSY